MHASRLAAPFQLLLVNKRFSDLVVHMLWNSLVFHGHDAFQMQSMLSTLGQEQYSAYEKTQQPRAPRDCQGFTSRMGSGFSVSDSVKSNVGGLRGLRKSVLRGILNDVCPRAAEDLPSSLLSSWAKSPAVSSRWTYSSFVRRVVLNFAHPQASPQMLVRVLECIQSRCGDPQIQALDLHANEKMRASELGLDTAAELDRLFGGQHFTGLQYLRLQGGFVDNQLLGALIKALSVPPVVGSRQPCSLSQVFLGPGSVTDSAIEKLIAVAGHSLEVFTVTSCVDVGGGALASLLTKCPKLRVLGVHKSLACDKELLAGLRIDTAMGSGSLETSPDQACGLKAIIAPLERLELGTVKLTIVGVTEIVKGTCQSLRFLSLGSRHFKEDFLKGVILTTCKRLEGLYFNDPECSLKQIHQQQQQQQPQHPHPHQHHPQHQQQQPPTTHMRDHSFERQPRRRHFEFGRVQRWLRAESPQELQSHQTCQYRSCQQSSKLRCSPLQKQDHSLSDQSRVHSPWLGETSTEQWVLHGNSIFWTTNSAATVSVMEAMENSETAPSFSMGQTRPRGTLSSLLRSVSNHLATLFAARDSTAVADVASDGDNAMDDNAVALTSEDAVDDSQYDLFERFEVSRGTVEAIQGVLRPLLKDFMVMNRDVISEMRSAASLAAEGSIAALDQKNEAAPPIDQLEVFLRLVVILGVIILGTAHTVA